MLVSKAFHNNKLEYTNNSLKLSVLELMDLPLRVFISTSIFMLLWIFEEEAILVTERNNIFTSSLLGTTIQDDSMRERSRVLCNKRNH